MTSPEYQDRKMYRMLRDGAPESLFVAEAQKQPQDFPLLKSDRAYRLEQATLDATQDAEEPNPHKVLEELGHDPNDTRTCINRKRE